MHAHSAQRSHAPAAAPGETAFGVSIGADARKDRAHDAPALPERVRRRRYRAIGAVVAAVIVAGAWWWTRDGGELDSEAASNAGVRDVLKMERKGDVAGLRRLAGSDDPAVASRAVAALAGSGDVASVGAALRDSRMEVRYAAVTGLAQSGDPAQLDAMTQVLKDPAPEVRIAAVRGVSGVRDFSIFERLIPMLSDPQSSVRRAAIGAIEERIGLRFDDFNADAYPEARAKAVARIKATVPHFRARFETANAFEVERERKAQNK
jgi:HEAT repeat protein